MESHALEYRFLPRDFIFICLFTRTRFPRAEYNFHTKLSHVKWEMRNCDRKYVYICTMIANSVNSIFAGKLVRSFFEGILPVENAVVFYLFYRQFGKLWCVHQLSIWVSVFQSISTSLRYAAISRKISIPTWIIHGQCSPIEKDFFFLQENFRGDDHPRMEGT